MKITRVRSDDATPFNFYWAFAVFYHESALILDWRMNRFVLWHLRHGQQKLAVPKLHPTITSLKHIKTHRSTVAVSKDGAHLIVGGHTSPTIAVWKACGDGKSYSHRFNFSYNRNVHYWTRVALMEDGSTIVATSMCGYVVMWGVRDDGVMCHTRMRCDYDIQMVRFITRECRAPYPASRIRVVMGAYNGNVRMYDFPIRSMAEDKPPALIDHKRCVTAIAVSDADDCVASASKRTNEEIVLSNLVSATNGFLHPCHTSTADITQLAWMRDDCVVASMTRDDLCICSRHDDTVLLCRRNEKAALNHFMHAIPRAGILLLCGRVSCQHTARINVWSYKVARRDFLEIARVQDVVAVKPQLRVVREKIGRILHLTQLVYALI